LEDKLLIWKLKRGNTDALRQIYEKYRSDLLRVASCMLTETAQAEDAVQDVFVGFVESCTYFKLTGSLRSYLVTCVANRARNLNRTKARQYCVELEGASHRVSYLKRPDEWLVHDDEFQRVHEAMCKLPYEQREVIALRAQGDMKFREIAQLQGTSVKTTLSRYRYGMEKLSTLFQEEA
jgi:RNA polymerase sigma-70 factor (ECF subfamily)